MSASSASGQQREARRDGRPAIAFVLQVRWQAQRLAEVFLGKPGDPLAAFHPFAVEALHEQGFLVAERGHFSARHGQAERLDDLRAQPFVVDRAEHVHLGGVGDHAERELEDVGARGGGCTTGC